MTIIAHLSDTHFGTEVPEVVAAIEEALLALPPDIIILSGDVTQRARPSQFQAAADFLQRLPTHTKLVIPGNHDIPLYNIGERLMDPYSNYSHVFGLREQVWCVDDIGIIGFDATSRWRHTRGKLSDMQVIEQTKRAREQLKPDAILVACVHQPLYTAWPEDKENILIRAEHTANLFAEHGVDMVLSGHVHVPLIATTQELYPQLPRHFVLSGAGTAVSYRTRPRAPNSFNSIRIGSEGGTPSIEVTLMEYDKESGQFVAKQSQRFMCLSNSWRSAGKLL